MELVVGQIVSGLFRASFLFFVTIGLSLLWGMLGVLNVAQVSFYMLGAYVTYTLWQVFQAVNFSYWVSVPLACLAVGLIGLVIEFLLMRRLYSRSLAEVLLATFALIYVFNDLAKIVWGVETRSIPTPEILTKALSAVVTFPASYVFSIGIAVLLGLGLWWWLHRTKFGKVVRATQSDREIVAALGLPVPWILTSVFVVSALLAALGGAVWMATCAAQPGRLDIPMVPMMFCTMIIGGMGSLVGTAVAAIIVGESIALSILVFPNAGLLPMFVVSGLVLMVRPWGLFGAKGRLG